jgi:hypothetical protein
VYDSCQHNAKRLLSKKEKGQEQESSHYTEPFYKLSGERKGAPYADVC